MNTLDRLIKFEIAQKWDLTKSIIHTVCVWGVCVWVCVSGVRVRMDVVWWSGRQGIQPLIYSKLWMMNMEQMNSNDIWNNDRSINGRPLFASASSLTLTPSSVLKQYALTLVTYTPTHKHKHLRFGWLRDSYIHKPETWIKQHTIIRWWWSSTHSRQDSLILVVGRGIIQSGFFFDFILLPCCGLLIPIGKLQTSESGK